MRRYQHTMAMLRTKRIWERRCIQYKHSIILCMSWLISRLRYLALLRHPTRLDFACQKWKEHQPRLSILFQVQRKRLQYLCFKGETRKNAQYIHPSAHAFLLPSVGQRYACCRRSTFHVCFSYTFFLSTFWRFPVAQNFCFTSCYNETVYKQNTSLPFWHRFDVSDQDERCLDISRFKWWMAIIVRSWKQGLQSMWQSSWTCQSSSR